METIDITFLSFPFMKFAGLAWPVFNYAVVIRKKKFNKFQEILALLC